MHYENRDYIPSQDCIYVIWQYSESHKKKKTKMLPHIYDHISVTPFIKKKLAISRIKSYFFNENKCQWKAKRKNKLIYE